MADPEVMVRAAGLVRRIPSGHGAKPAGGTVIERLSADAVERWSVWRGTSGPPVPVVIERTVWEQLVSAALATPSPVARERVFRLFMRRREPRRVLAANEITSTWSNERGTLRWNEGGYPALSEQLRKGGNAVIRDHTELRLDDAWWMGRELTELRIILSPALEGILVSGWWGRGGSGGLKAQETDGELWPVRLLISEETV